MSQADDKSVSATTPPNIAATAKSISAKTKTTSKPKTTTPVASKVTTVAKSTTPGPSTTDSPSKRSESDVATKIPVPKGQTAMKGPKGKKIKLVRDSFSMPEDEYELFGALKKRCIAGGIAAKKSEVLRAALITFSAQSDASIVSIVKSLPPIKTGRPPQFAK